MIGYRIHKQKPGPDFIGTHHISRPWNDTHVASDTRQGVSCCESYQRLLWYFRGNKGEHSVCRAADLEGAWLVVFEGELSDDTPWEEGREILLHPARIVSVQPLEETTFIADLLKEANEEWGEYCPGKQRYTTEVIWQGGEFLEREECEACDGTGQDDEEDDGECWQCDGKGHELRRR